MSVDIATLKANAEQIFEKAVAGEATIIEQNGKRAVLLPCNEDAPDFELYPKIDALLATRLYEPAAEATETDWETLRQSALNR